MTWSASFVFISISVLEEQKVYRGDFYLFLMGPRAPSKGLSVAQGYSVHSMLIQLNLTPPCLTRPNLTQPHLTQPNLTQPNLTRPNLTQPNLT